MVAAPAVPIIALTVREETGAEVDSTSPAASRTPAVEVGKKDVEGVFLIGEDNKVTFRAVRVGIAGEKHFEVLGGLTGGERIVAGSYQAIRELKEGQMVKEATEPTTAGTKAP